LSPAKNRKEIYQALGHVADEEAHQAFRRQMEDSETLREDTRNLLLFERAREWLLEETAE
jgi:hypothetical protein